jgi:hypothetical protein
MDLDTLSPGNEIYLTYSLFGDSVNIITELYYKAYDGRTFHILADSEDEARNQLIHSLAE